ncbi:SCO family protein [Sphingomonas lenta]|uniref:SCO family protein n=1 Tax=Sphingomonas lenta TaxID=1141887 RepID=A0A2A2SES9_9SPHN|nr:SCO family protein [Sphingomonas lenta]PAX07511.1 SCO family protein [Sphingomonas lenta]
MNIRALLAGAALALSGCGAAEPPEAPPLAGARIGGPFALTGEDGRTVTDRDLAGKWRVMYFGYTFCPDICPTDAQNIAAGLKRFEAEDAARAAKITPVFVTIDPARDTPDVLARFTDAFHPRMLGLTGSAEAIGQIAKAYAVYYAKGEASPGGGYLMDHSRQSYLMDPQGRPVALIPQDKGADAVAAELERWVR